MNKDIAELVEIFAQSDIESLKQLWIKNKGKPWFNAEIENLRKIKKRLQITVGKQSSPKNQVIQALKILNRTKVLGRKFVKTANTKDNLLAKAIHAFLKREGGKFNLIGFFYPQQERDNQKVSEKLNSACEHCFVFIQLVQNIIFDYEEKNYCYLEYSKYCETHSSNKYFIFLLDGPHDNLKESDYIHPEYDEWHKEIDHRDAISLERIEDKKSSDQQIPNLLRSLRKNLVEKINQIKWKIIEDVPD